MTLHATNGGYIGVDGRKAKSLADKHAAAVTLLLAPDNADTGIINKLGGTTISNSGVTLVYATDPWGRYNKVLGFGGSQKISLTNLNINQLDGATDYTVEVWFNKVGTGYGQLIGKPVSGGQWGLGADTNLYYDFPSNNASWYLRTPTNAVGVWTFAAVVRQGNTVFHYKDNAYLGSREVPATAQFSELLEVGSEHGSWYHNGKIAALRITKAAREQDQLMYSRPPSSTDRALSGVWSI
jgi:hypothetical protein